MQRIIAASFAAFALLIATGCPKSPEGGKTDKAKTDSTKPAADGTKNTTADNKDQTFTITKINTDVNVTQGGANEAKIDINRSNNFTQSIKLEALKVPEKLKVEFSPANVKASDKNVVMKVNAEKDAPVGVHTIRVQGTPDMGTATGIDVNIEVKKQ